MQNRAIEADVPGARRVGVQRVAVAGQAVQQRLVAPRVDVAGQIRLALRRPVRRDPLAPGAAEAAVAARNDRAAERKQRRVVGREAPLGFEQD